MISIIILLHVTSISYIIHGCVYSILYSILYYISPRFTDQLNFTLNFTNRFPINLPVTSHVFTNKISVLPVLPIGFWTKWTDYTLNAVCLPRETFQFTHTFPIYTLQYITHLNVCSREKVFFLSKTRCFSRQSGQQYRVILNDDKFI